jgi:cystathionine gamma-lyase
MDFETRAIHAGETPNCKEGGSGDVVAPVHLSSTFARMDVRKPTGGYEYSRTGNPTRDALETRLAALENARYGLAFASGLAAQTTICLSLLKAGDHVVAFDDLYGGSRRLFEKVFTAGFHIEVSYVDARRVEAVAEAVRANTTLIWMETPTNPLLRLCDIQAIAGISREKGIALVVDNTFMSPFFQHPLALGADMAVHSTTKYICGHSDSVGGAIMLNRRDLYERLKFVQNAAGTMQSPFNSYLLLRSTKTLAVRMRLHQANALKVAQFLSTHPRVSRVLYPGLESHPQHELARKQMSGYGGMVSFEIAGNLADAEAFLRHVRIFALAESLGGVESLIEHPALMTHASVPAEVRREIGVSDTLIRISVGIEEERDLVDDLKQAFEKI